MARLNQDLRELRGPLLPVKDEAEEEEDCLEDAEEEEDPGFVDAEELCSGGVQAGSLPGRLQVVIHDENTQEKCKVFGRFPITGAWWRVNVRVKPVGSKHYQVQGFPSYFLQSDMSSPHQKNICSLFLKECGICPEEKEKFLSWVNKVSSYKDLNFENLRETLRNFYKAIEKNSKKRPAQNEKEEFFLDELSLPLETTFPFRTVMTALQFPKVLEFIPVLLPRHFTRLINSGSEGVLEKIEEILGTHPWKLGFSKITYRDLQLLRCEASWMAFRQCTPLLQLMSDLEKNALAIYSKLKQICREHGHTCIREADLTSELVVDMSFYEAWQSLKFLKDIGVVIFQKDWIFPYDLYQAERSIASSICDLLERPPWHLQVDVKKVLASIHTAKPEGSRSEAALADGNPDSARLENSGDILDPQDSDDHVWNNSESKINAEINEAQLDLDQVTALKMICSNAVTVISGKGGCGKTTIVSHLFKHMEQLEEKEVKKACEDFEQDQDVPEEWLTFTEQSHLGLDKAIEVLLTAPTGKATGLLRQKTGLPAYTLHQVNYSFYLWDKNLVKKEEPWKFSSVRVLVVDEGSLVSVGIFKSVLRLLCDHSKLSKLIILGDIRQLPSIEPGNLLKDLFETFKSRNCAIELKTNHRAESQLIVDNATRISGRNFPNFDAELNVSDNFTFPISIQDKTFIFIRLPEDDASSQSSKSEHSFYLYSAVRTLLQEKDFANAETSQFIAFRRQDCDIINDCCCKHYTGRLIKDHRKRFIFGVGDKICCTRNAYLSELLPENTFESQPNSDLEASGEGFHGTLHDSAKNKKHNFESGTRLCNGEIFFITGDVTDITFGKRRFLTINNMAGLEVTVDFNKLVKHCHIRHAWARTIHTFQGSEENTVVYVVGKAGRQHWQHVYTAVTRGRSRVYVVAEESQLHSAIRRNSVLRNTRLKHFLQNQLSVSSASPTDLPSQLKSSRDSEGPRTPPSASPLPKATARTATAEGPGSEASSPEDRTFTLPAGWQLTSFDETDDEEDLSQSRGPKRISGVNDCESPSKVRMVEESPHVSSRFQNLKLNKFIPKQLFKPTDNQEN